MSFLWAIMTDLPTHLSALSQQMGPWLYLLLFLVIFAETGLIVFPFLPGDSLLFAVGALAALAESGLQIPYLLPLLSIGAILGDTLNYHIGHWVGPKVFSQPKSRFLNPEHLHRTQRFYEKNGGRTIILARFIPIIRTYAPFVAGIAQMSYRRFAAFNIVGGIIWISSFLGAGYFFGNLPSVKTNFHYVILAIIVISFVPVVVEFCRARAERSLT